MKKKLHQYQITHEQEEDGRVRTSVFFADNHSCAKKYARMMREKDETICYVTLGGSVFRDTELMIPDSVCDGIFFEDNF